MCHLCAYAPMFWALVFISELAFIRAVLLSTPTVFSSFIALHCMFKSSTHFVLVCVWRQGLASFFCVVWAPFIEENVAFPVVFLEPWLKCSHKCTIFHLSAGLYVYLPGPLSCCRGFVAYLEIR